MYLLKAMNKFITKIFDIIIDKIGGKIKHSLLPNLNIEERFISIHTFCTFTKRTFLAIKLLW